MRGNTWPWLDVVGGCSQAIATTKLPSTALSLMKAKPRKKEREMQTDPWLYLLCYCACALWCLRCQRSGACISTTLVLLRSERDLS